MEPNDPQSDADTLRSTDPPDGASKPSTQRSQRSLGSRLAAVRGSLGRVIEVLRGTRLDLPTYDPAAHGPLVSFEGLDGCEEVERYWVNAPFSFVTVQYDPDRSAHLYVTVEPDLDDEELALLETLLEDVRDPLLYRDGESANVERRLRETIHELLERYGADIDVATFYRLFYYVYRDFRGYGRLDPIMHDPHVEDVSCDGYDLPIFVYHDRYTDVETTVSFGEAELDRFVVRLAQQSGRHISIGDPMVETTLPDGSRAELALGREVTPRGSAFTVRKYADEPFTPVDLLEYGTFSVEQMAYLWLTIEHNRSLIFAGGTASGKTTSMNAISMFIPPRAKVLTIEDTRELQLHHDNWLSSITRERIHEGKDVTMYDLLRSALRHRPEYIVVGEVRGEEAITLFQAMNTGHTTYSTMHADSVQTAINRLENEPINVPRSMVQSLDVLSVQTLTRLDGERVRRNRVLAEIEGVDQRTGELDYSTTYTWDGDTDTFSGGGSRLLEEIRDERGWSQRELLVEVRNREAFLEYVWEQGIDDYRRFTALVNEYYSDKATVLETIGRTASIEESPIGRAEAAAGRDESSGDAERVRDRAGDSGGVGDGPGDDPVDQPTGRTDSVDSVAGTNTGTASDRSSAPLSFDEHTRSTDDERGQSPADERGHSPDDKRIQSTDDAHTRPPADVRTESTDDEQSSGEASSVDEATDGV